jgi:hypothetical protein
MTPNHDRLASKVRHRVALRIANAHRTNPRGRSCDPSARTGKQLANRPQEIETNASRQNANITAFP